MSAAEDSISGQVKPKRKSAPFLNRALDFLSSVRFGVVTLCILVVLSMIGMLIMQQNVQGFEAYYASLTPAEKTLFAYLGFFDIYHSWYYNLLLLVLSLNIILASIDRFPSAWSYIVKPKIKATRPWMLAREQNEVFELESETKESAVSKAIDALKAAGMRVKTGEDGAATMVFGEKGRWNRMGAYIVHVFLLMLFLGHFVSLQTGFDADVRMVPGAATDEIQLIRFNLDRKEKYAVKLPFTMECTDIEQKLIDHDGPIDVNNTLDWRTELKITDPQYGEIIANASLNKPFHYRGYRFFQAQTIPVGNARVINLELTPTDGGPAERVEIKRNGSATLANGTLIEYADFQPDFTLGPDGNPDTRSGEYNNPAAVLFVTAPGQERTRVFAFAQKMPDNIPIGAPKAGYKWQLIEFEKSPYAHILSIKYDPYEGAFIAWYIGGFGLMGALVFVFFTSHKRIWVRVEKKADGDGVDVVFAGEANRNKMGFGDLFKGTVEKFRSIIGK
jgi:cytochrome c biogenesis protein